jgi:serine/threonine protein kinase
MMVDWLRDFQSMKEIRVIEEGAFGSATLVVDPFTQEEITAKSLNANENPRGGVSQMVMRTTELLIVMTHSCYVPFVGFSPPTDMAPARIGTKFAARGSLRRALDKRRSGECPAFLDDTGAAKMIMGLVRGGKFICSHGVVHGGLTPSNIVTDERGWPQISGLVGSRLALMSATVIKDVGRGLYTAPEVNDDDCTAAADIYSFSLIPYELLVGDYVFPPTTAATDLKEQSRSSTRPLLPPWVRAAAKGMMSHGLSGNAKERPTFEAIEGIL